MATKANNSTHYPGTAGHKNESLAILAEAIETGQKDGSIAKDIDPWVMSVLLWSTSNGVLEMIKNRSEILKLLGLPIDQLYPTKEILIDRGLTPVKTDKENGN